MDSIWVSMSQIPIVHKGILFPVELQIETEDRMVYECIFYSFLKVNCNRYVLFFNFLQKHTLTRCYIINSSISDTRVDSHVPV